MRQPLRKAVIVATEAERVEIERLAEIVSAELNVKELEFVTEEGELVSYSVKPNYRTLGPRFGKAMPQVAAAIESLDPEHAAEAIRGERRIGVSIDGHDHSLEPEDLTLVMQPLDGYEVEAEAGRAVALALELDDELRREGRAREIVHAIQNARKQAGLEVTDRIKLSLGGDPALIEAARAHEDYVAGETLATSVAYDGAGGGQPRRSTAPSCGSRSSASLRSSRRRQLDLQRQLHVLLVDRADQLVGAGLLELLGEVDSLLIGDAGGETSAGSLLLDDIVLAVADPFELDLGSRRDRRARRREEVVADGDRRRAAGQRARSNGKGTRPERATKPTASAALARLIPRPAPARARLPGASSAGRRRRAWPRRRANRIRVGIESTS